MNVGLLYTPVSIFQMTRGALVLFVGILSVLFLRRRLHLYQWLALIIVMGGVAVVGLSGSLVKQVLSSDPQQLAVEEGPPPETSVLIGASFHSFFHLPVRLVFLCICLRLRLRLRNRNHIRIRIRAFLHFVICFVSIRPPRLAAFEDRRRRKQ